MCALIISLSIWSLWLPSNYIFLAIILFICIIYWAINYQKAGRLYDEIKKSIRDSLSTSELILVLSFIVVFVFFFTWQQDVYDSAFYHYQNIRWNEEYAVVPGIANIDDRFGFNSNYFLLSAIFSFRSLFGEAIYTLQSLIVTLIGLWILYELFKYRYEAKRLIIFATYILLFWASIYFLGNTSTDIMPNFIAFYIVARLILYPRLLKEYNLLLIILPVFLLTCKLSFFPGCIFSLYLLYSLIKKKDYKATIFLCSVGALIVILWLTRNVIVSGYLVYPLYRIDLFDFDWKVPAEVAMKQREYIFAIGYYFFRIAVRYPHTGLRDSLTINILTDIIFLLTTLSLIVMSYFILKKRTEVHKNIHILYIAFILSIVIWATGGPDIRFISGIFCAIIFTAVILLLGDKDKRFPLLSKTVLCVFILSITVWCSIRYYNLHTAGEQSYTQLVSHFLYKPYSVKDQQKAKGFNIEDEFETYPINNGLFIWVGSVLPYDMTLPASIHSDYSKFSPINCIEARGNTIQEGFRAKENCK